MQSGDAILHIMVILIFHRLITFIVGFIPIVLGGWCRAP
jgi:hypothetical protein